MKGDVRWATADDYRAMPCGPAGVTRRGLALEIDGELAGLISITVNRNSGIHEVSAAFRPQARTSPKHLHAFGLKAIDTAKELGIRTLHAVADPAIPRSEAWLERLGFECVGELDGGKVYRCKLV